MNILNFEEFVSEKVKERGYDYYASGSIVEKYVGADEYLLVVNGSDRYEVVVKLGENGEIISSNCDCPYDYGPICKHQVAAFYELLEDIHGIKQDVKKIGKKSRKESGKKIELIDVLRELSKEELITVILDLDEKDEVLESNLVYKYSKHDYEDEIKLCKKAIKEVVRAHKGRQGFIPYRDVFDYVRDMEAILEKASKMSDHNVAVAIPLLVLEEAIKAFQYADDSSGSIGFLVRGAIKELSEIAMYAEDYELEQRAEIFDAILRQCDSPIFNGWEEFSIELLSVCLEFADVPTLRAKLQDKVNTLLRAYTDNRYRKEELLHIQFDLVNEYGSSEEVEAFL